MLKIKNLHELKTNPLKESGLLIAEAGLEAIDTRFLIQKNIKLEDESVSVGGVPFRIGPSGKIFLVAVGKCASLGAEICEEILGNKIYKGIALDVYDYGIKEKKIHYCSGTHPFTTKKNIDKTAEIIELLKEASENDFVIFLISGGGSTLLCMPNDNSCENENFILNRLFAVGANIKEINTVRKHLSFARGGHLARYAYPAKSVALIFSDVPGNDLDFVASGPTVIDQTTIKDAENILHKYEILENCPREGCGLLETPKYKKYFENVTNVLFMSNILALNAMHNRAIELGFKARIVTDRIEGEAREVGMRLVENIQKEISKTCLIYGGETTVTLDKRGRGGRNCEVALSALETIEKDGILIMAVASDGHDNGEYGGAIADFDVKKKAKDSDLNIRQYLSEHNSISFFEKTGDYLMMGNTGSNVSDLFISIKQ